MAATRNQYFAPRFKPLIVAEDVVFFIILLNGMKLMRTDIVFMSTNPGFTQVDLDSL